MALIDFAYCKPHDELTDDRRTTKEYAPVELFKATISDPSAHDIFMLGSLWVVIYFLQTPFSDNKGNRTYSVKDTLYMKYKTPEGDLNIEFFYERWGDRAR